MRHLLTALAVSMVASPAFADDIKSRESRRRAVSCLRITVRGVPL